MKIAFSAFLITCLICGSGYHQKISGAEPGSVAVIDGRGRKIYVPGKVNRIVTNYGIAAHMVFALGGWNKLVGIDIHSKRSRFLNAIYPGVSSMKSTGTVSNINIEQTLSLKPDLILVSGKNKILVDQLASYGLPVFGIVVDDLEQLKHTVHNLGVALNRKKKAEQFISYYNATLDLVNNRLKGLSEEDRPLVFMTGPMGVLSTCPQDMYQHSLIEVCGGRNAGGMLTAGYRRGWAEISAEQLIKWNPDMILVVQYSGVTPEEILADRRWQNITAVQNQKVCYFPSCFSPWDFPSPQAALGIRWLAATLHPEKFRDADTLKETNAFYKTFYGKTFSELGGNI